MGVTTYTSYFFALRANAFGKVVLSSVVGNVNDKTYTVVLGGDNNRKIEILYENQVKKSRFYNNLLDPSNDVSFWISWMDKRLSVGFGTLLSQFELLSWDIEDQNRIDVKAIAFGGGKDKPLKNNWTIIRPFYGEVIDVFTPNSYNYQRTWYYPQKEYIEFAVQACKDAHIALSREAGVTNNDTYEIVLGAGSNTFSTIRYKPGGASATYANTRNILDCFETRKFWIKFANNTLSVGTGNYLKDSKSFMSYSNSKMYSVTSFSFSTGFGAEGRWQVAQRDVTLLNTRTKKGELLKYVGVTRIDREVIQFAVRACSQAQLIMSTIPGETKKFTYVLRMDYDGKIQLMKDDSVIKSEDFENFLDCDKFIPLWITWDKTVFRLGKNENLGDTKVFEAYIGEKIDVNSLTMASDVDALWEFSFENSSSQIPPTLPPVSPILPDGEFLKFNTRNLYNYGQTMFTVSEDFIVFSVQANNDAFILLMGFPDDYDRETYEILIGGARNTVTEIRPGIMEEAVQRKNTPNILNSTSPKAFWISWRDNYIQVGEGTEFNKNPIISWRNPRQQPVRSVSISTGFGSEGQWYFPRDVPLYTQLSRKGNDIAFNLKSTSKHWVIFAVKACKNVEVTLGRTINDGGVYILYIGRNGEKTELADVASNKKLVSVSTPDILSCTEKRFFWISWVDQISFGTSSTLYEDIVLEWGYSIYNITSISILSSSDGITEWDINRYPSSTIITDGNIDFSISLLNRPTFAFNVKSCGDAQLNFMTNNGTIEKLTHKLILGTDRNTKSVLKRVEENSEVIVAQNTTNQLLSCNEYRPFWIAIINTEGNRKRWVVGEGTLSTQNIFIDVEEEFPQADISEAQVASGFNRWLFRRQIDKGYSWNTEPFKYFNQLSLNVIDSDFIVFNVLTTKYIYLLLEEYSKMPLYRAYQIQIGGKENDAFEVTRGIYGPVLFRKDRLFNIIRNERWNTFWLSWKKGILKFGEGPKVGSLERVSWKMDPFYNVRTISFSTGSGYRGQWKLSPIVDTEIISARTHNSFHLDRFILIPVQPYFEMQATAGYSLLPFLSPVCHISLSRNPANITDRYYLITMKTGRNQEPYVRIRKYIGGNIVKEKNTTANVIDPMVMKKIWFTWDNGIIKFGRGSWGTKEIISFEDEDDHIDVNALSFSGDIFSPASWNIPRYLSSEVYSFQSYTAYLSDTHISAPNSKFFTFYVKCRYGARIVLSETLRETRSQTYEVYIGYLANKVTRINKRFTTSLETSVSTDTPGILNDEEKRPFWVSWNNDIVAIGRGLIPGKDTVLEYIDKPNEFFPVNFVSLASNGRVPAIFYFGIDQGRA